MGAVTEPVIEEGNFLVAQRTGATEPVQHLGADLLVSGISAQSAQRQRSSLIGGVQAGFRQSLQLVQAFRQGIEGKGFLLIAQRRSSLANGGSGTVLQSVKNTHRFASIYFILR